MGPCYIQICVMRSVIKGLYCTSILYIAIILAAGHSELAIKSTDGSIFCDQNENAKCLV